MFSCEYCGIFKITCFEEHLTTAAFIRCYFDTISLKQSDFYTTYAFEIINLERKYSLKNKTKTPLQKIKQKLLCNPKDFSFMPEQVYYFLETKFPIHVFKMCYWL